MRLLCIALVAILGTAEPCAAEADLHLVADLVLGHDRPIGIVLEVVEDSRGRLYLADSGFTTIHVFSADGTFRRQISGPGEGPGMLMIPFVLAIDAGDRLVVAGAGGRVAIWDTDGNHVNEFRRRNPDGTVKSIAVSPAGDVVLATYDPFGNTVADVYRPDGEHLLSIPATHDPVHGDDPRVRPFFGGGSIDVEPDGSILYTQQYPYLVQRFSPHGDLLDETDEGGAGWLPEPPKPRTDRETFSVRLPGSSIDIRRVGDHVLNTATRSIGDTRRETLLTLYDTELELVAKTVLEGLHSVVGVDRQNRVLIFDRDQEDVPIVTRYEIRVGDDVPID